MAHQERHASIVFNLRLQQVATGCSRRIYYHRPLKSINLQLTLIIKRLLSLPSRSSCKQKNKEQDYIVIQLNSFILTYHSNIIRYDPTSGRHFVLKEVSTTQNNSGFGSIGTVEPEIRRSMHITGVSASGSLPKQHDMRVTGFMNYKQRHAYARDKRNDGLKVTSPRSLLGRSTE